ncbi:TetR/AcrR family transcriptional regulator C-terminal domain-containing protein [Arthrobacter sp. NPDC056493]|uniref:TetR/AcrR family transcriptional regulator C-terminal domain-containing protein n=1 Tax=Arthrobacter sp. NPDC056493 TaxID=3345839 RepID=UPI00366AA3C2
MGELTMRAVAERLGVNRKALNYHVSDRDGLLDLLAAYSLADGMSAIELSLSRDWRDLLRDFASQTRTVVASLGDLAEYSRVDAKLDAAALKPAEAVLRSLLRAGFSTRTAGLVLANIAELAFSAGRNDIDRADASTHKTTASIRQILKSTREPGFPAMEAVLLADNGLLGEEQFQFDLRVAILGLEQILANEA